MFKTLAQKGENTTVNMVLPFLVLSEDITDVGPFDAVLLRCGSCFASTQLTTPRLLCLVYTIKMDSGLYSWNMRLKDNTVHVLYQE